MLSIVILAVLAFAFVKYGANLKFGSKDPALTLSTNAQHTETGPSGTLDSSRGTMNDPPAIEEKNPELALGTSTTVLPPSESTSTYEKDTTSPAGTDFQEQIDDPSNDSAQIGPSEPVKTENENAFVVKAAPDVGAVKESPHADNFSMPAPQRELNENPLTDHSLSGDVYSEVKTIDPSNLNTLSVIAIEKTWLKYTIDDFSDKRNHLNARSGTNPESKRNL